MERKSLFIFLLLPVIILGQTNNFEFTQQDTAYSGSEDFIVQYGTIVNLINENQEITVTRVKHFMPDTWTNSFCVGTACLPPFLDQHTFTLESGATAEFSLDTYPNGEVGTGSWTIFAENVTTSEIDSVHITLEFITVSIDVARHNPTSFELLKTFPNPTNAYINFDLQISQSGSYKIVMYGLDGRLITDRSYSLRAGNNLLQWSVNDLSSGNYLLVASGNGQTLTRKVSVIK